MAANGVFTQTFFVNACIFYIFPLFLASALASSFCLLNYTLGMSTCLSHHGWIPCIGRFSSGATEQASAQAICGGSGYIYAEVVDEHAAFGCFLYVCMYLYVNIPPLFVSSA